MTSCDKTKNPILYSKGCGFSGNSRNSNPYDLIDLFQKMFSLTIKTEKYDLIKPPRCMVCRKKMGLIRPNCKCNEVFCENHRRPEDHSCAFGFKSVGYKVLTKENSLCKADKLKDMI